MPAGIDAAALEAQIDAARRVPHPTRSAGRTDERQGFLRDVFTTGLEGGIGYWSVTIRYRWKDADTFHAVIVPDGEHHTEDGTPAWGVWPDDDPRETAPLRIDADVIARGLALYRRWAYGEIDYTGQPTGTRQPLPSSICTGVIEADRTNFEEGDIDAGDADAVIQFGLFGAAIFG